MNMVVTLPYRPLWEPVQWAKENCPSYISNDAHRIGDNAYDNSKIDYFFSDEHDAFKFALRWA
jgi:hypothetical protein